MISVDADGKAAFNWGLLCAVGTLLLALWAAAIRPLANDTERAEKASATLAAAVLLQNDKITKLEIEISRMEVTQKVLEDRYQYLLSVDKQRLGMPQK